jgi:serine phosphatase RsbU (regulator of sigma subunit)
MEYLDNTFSSAMSLTRDNSDSLRDGMDICLIKQDITTNQVEFCGAGRPLYYIQNGELIEIKGNNLAIGGIKRKEVVFESHTIDLQGGERFYLTSDGYADQSDENRKKLGTKRLKELIKEMQSKDFDQQMLELKYALESHKGETEQRDDVSIIGIEF